MVIIEISNERNIVEPNGEDTQWLSTEINGQHLFPYNNQFNIGGYTWLIEVYIISGRNNKDNFMFHLLRQDENGVQTFIIDTILRQGNQYTIDNTIRVLGYRVNPKFIDNYESSSEGEYEILISEVKNGS